LDQGKTDGAAENWDSSSAEDFVPQKPQPSSRKQRRAKPKQRPRKGGAVPQPRVVRVKDEAAESDERDVRRESVESADEKAERDDAVCSLPEA
jgi:hypothetical protein